ncbi:hypothetical protein [Streptomyces albiaxialis]|uniref:hypothetical protein n=1 Tax=Streptomyces albiaxialis TaxID=329523 RepID=UPI0031DE1F45
MLEPYPWLAAEGDTLRERVLDLALARADAPGPDEGEPRWRACDHGGDWSRASGELVWLRADVPEDVRHPRLPVQPMTRLLVAALGRAGALVLSGVRADLPLQITAGDATGELEDLRDWFALADPSASVGTTLVATGVRASRAEAERVRDALRERIAPAAEPHDVRGGGPGPDADRLRFHVRTREWSPEVAVWLVEAAGDALRATGHAVPVTLTASAP